MDISIIITYYSGLNILKNCISHLVESLKNITFNHEIIIVNDNPNVLLEEHLKMFSMLTIINHKQNQGHPTACNTGAKYASGKFLVFMDCDIFVTGHWIESLLETYNKIPNTGAISSTILDMATNKIHMTGIAVHQVDMLKILRGANLDILTGSCGFYDFLSSACIMIPKNIFEQVDGFDTVFFNADGDLDLTYRIKQNGYQLVTAYESLVFHKGRVAGAMRNLSVNDTKALFFKKWGNQLPDGIFLLQNLYTDFHEKNDIQSEYLLINLSKSLFLKDYLKIIEKSLNIKIIQLYNFKQHATQIPISLFDFVEENLAHYNVPIIFFSDNFNCLTNNFYWLKLRNNFQDLSIDINGNICYLQEINL